MGGVQGKVAGKGWKEKEEGVMQFCSINNFFKKNKMFKFLSCTEYKGVHIKMLNIICQWGMAIKASVGCLTLYA